MFTGIVERTGQMVALSDAPQGKTLTVDVGPLAQGLALGASVAVSGVCLTVTHVEGERAAFDVIPETLKLSTLGDKRIGDLVNLERSVCVGDRLDGHFVQGHVDGTAVVDGVESGSSEWVLWLRVPADQAAFIIPKGSVALDGVSLTIAMVRGHRFSVALIPTTLTATTLGHMKPGDRVNLETDIIARTIVHQLRHISGTAELSMDTLRQAGYA